MSDFRRQDEVLTIRLNSELIMLKIELNFFYLWFHKWAWWFFVFDIFLTKCNITFLIWSLGVNLKPNTWVLKSYNKKFRFHFTLYMYIHCIAELVWRKVCVGIAGCWITHFEKHTKKVKWDTAKDFTSVALMIQFNIVNLFIFYYLN